MIIPKTFTSNPHSTLSNYTNHRRKHRQTTKCQIKKPNSIPFPRLRAVRPQYISSNGQWVKTHQRFLPTMHEYVQPRHVFACIQRIHANTPPIYRVFLFSSLALFSCSSIQYAKNNARLR